MRTCCAASAGTTGSSPGAAADFLEGGAGRDTHDAGPGNDLVATSYDGAARRRAVRIRSRRRQRRSAGRCRPRLRARRPAALARPVHDAPTRSTRRRSSPTASRSARTTVATFQVGRRFDGAATNVGWAVTTNDGASWRSGLLPGLTTASRPPGPNERASDPVVAYDAAHGTWLISTLALEGATTRLAINRSANGATWSTALAGARGARRAGNRLRQELARVRQHGVVALLRPLLPRLHALRGPRHARGELDGRRRAHLVDARRHRRTAGSRDLPGDQADRRDRGRLPARGRDGSRSRRRDRPTEARRGARRSASRQSTAAARSAASARSHSRPPTSTERVACGRHGTTAQHRAHPGQRGLRRDVAGRHPWSAPSGGDATPERRPARDRDRRRDGTRRDRLYALAREPASTSSASSRRATRRAWSAPHAGCPRGRCRSDGCPTRRPGGCSATTSRCTTPADGRSSSGCSRTSPSERASGRRSTRRAAESRSVGAVRAR